MTTPLHHTYGTATGPFGFPMTDRQAFAVDALLKALPSEDAYAYRHQKIDKATTELMPGERCDVSWITTEDPDRSHEVVIARGMNDSQFQQNPLVTMQHCYHLPPVGKSLWRKRVKDGALSGIKAKTQYPQKPESWPDDSWPPDVAFALVQSDLLRGKSIGFLPLKVHAPSDKEARTLGWEKVSLVIDEWVLLEYACCYLPCQQNAVVEAVSKSGLGEPILKALGLAPEVKPVPAVSEVIAFTPIEEIEKAIGRHLQQIDFRALAEQQLDRLRGRV
jgi:hypothetical protein